MKSHSSIYTPWFRYLQISLQEDIEMDESNDNPLHKERI